MHRYADRGQRAVARFPQVTAAFVRDERFGCGAVVVPVALVRGANAREVDRERWIPVRQAVRTGDPRVVGCQPSIGRQPGDRHYASQRERRAARHEADRRIPEVVVDVKPVTGCRSQLACSPVVEDNRVGAGRHAGCLPASLRQQVQISRRDERVRDGPVTLTNRVRQICEDGCRLQAEPAHGTSGGSLERLADDAVGAVDDYGLRTIHCRDAHAEIFELKRGSEPGVGPFPAGNEDGVDLTGHGEVALQPPDRGKDRTHVGLLRPDRELAEAVARQHPGERQPDGAADVFLAAKQRFDWHLGRLLETRQKHISLFGADLRCERRRDHHAFGRRQPVERPEAFVDAIHNHLRGASSGRLERDEGVGDDERRRRAGTERALEVVRQVLTEESHRRQDLIGVSQPAERDVAQAVAHRVADDQRTGEHGHGRRHAQRHGEIGAPVKARGAEDEGGKVHGSGFTVQGFAVPWFPRVTPGAEACPRSSRSAPESAQPARRCG